MIGKEWETGLKPTVTLLSRLQFNTLPIYIQLPWSWRASFTPCFRISACTVNRKKRTKKHNDTFPLILCSKMGKEVWGCFLFHQKTYNWWLYFYFFVSCFSKEPC